MKTIRVLGPYCSGTNLLCNILKNTCDDIYIEIDDEMTPVWKHTLEIKLIENLIKNKDCIFIIMYKNIYNWINSITNNSYDVQYSGKDNPVRYQNKEYSSLIELYNTYYEMYIKLLIEYENFIWIDYYKLIKEDSFEYLCQKLRPFGLSLKSKDVYQKWLNTSSKNHGGCFQSRIEALERYSIINKKIKEDWIKSTINRDILTFFDDEFYQPSGDVFVLVCDKHYISRAKRTITDLRSIGNWCGDLVFITVGFVLNKNYRDFYNIINYPVRHINTDYLVSQYTTHPLKPTSDNRTLGKLGQWDKLQIFNNNFKRWDRVVYLDSGLRVLADVNHLLQLECRTFMAPEDTDPGYTSKQFKHQLDLTANKGVTDKLLATFSESILDAKYFINCMWVYNTNLLDTITTGELVEVMNEYPISMTNEMAIMNLIIHFKYSLWQEFPKMLNDKHLFGWSELNYNKKTWRDFYFIKYPVTINFECE